MAPTRETRMELGTPSHVTVNLFLTKRTFLSGKNYLKAYKLIKHMKTKPKFRKLGIRQDKLGWNWENIAM